MYSYSRIDPEQCTCSVCFLFLTSTPPSCGGFTLSYPRVWRSFYSGYKHIPEKFAVKDIPLKGCPKNKIPIPTVAQLFLKLGRTSSQENFCFQFNSIHLFLPLTKQYNINTLKMIHNIPTITIFLLNYLRDQMC